MNAAPVAPSAPTVTVTQPTCTTPTGSIVITSSTSGLEFSLDGGPYGVYPSSGYTATPGTHKLSVKNSSGCTATTDVVVNAAPAAPSAPTVAITQPTCSTPTGSIVVTSSTMSGSTYSIDNGLSYVNTNTFTGLGAGTYMVRVQYPNGCISPATTCIIIQPPSFKVDLFADQVQVVQGAVVNFRTSSNKSFSVISWKPNQVFNYQNTSTQSIRVDSTLDVVVIAKSNEGCLDTAAVKVVVAPVNDIYIPSAFTPNGDGKNDILRILGPGIQELDFKIFNRWGQLIFSTTDVRKGWDGTLGGKTQPGDVYVYTIKIKKADGSIINRRGTVTLIK